MSKSKIDNLGKIAGKEVYAGDYIYMDSGMILRVLDNGDLPDIYRAVVHQSTSLHTGTVLDTPRVNKHITAVLPGHGTNN